MLANPTCNARAGTRAQSLRPMIMPTMLETMKAMPESSMRTPAWNAPITPMPEIRLITISDVAMIPRICTSVSCLKAGTIRKPPPTPSNPETTPVTAPSAARVAVHLAVQEKRPVC
ncbi:hypothetical protein D9M73_293710 [compost metagenome]